MYCQGEGACDGVTINGPSSSSKDLQVSCTGSGQGPCANLEINGGANSEISVDCGGDDSACLNGIFRASTARSFTLSDCTHSAPNHYMFPHSPFGCCLGYDQSSCHGITVECPPNVNGNTRCTLEGPYIANVYTVSTASNLRSTFVLSNTLCPLILCLNPFPSSFPLCESVQSSWLNDDDRSFE